MIPELDYAFYVWTSYGVFAVTMLWQFVQPRLRHRRLLAELHEERALTDGYAHDTNA
ncbi:MAG: heme exporter protein CcmD [Pseudomonadota bacterium]|nr:MAG: heme exporter protein CcmD [Pseudomonadota bacterium]